MFLSLTPVHSFVPSYYSNFPNSDASKCKIKSLISSLLSIAELFTLSFNLCNKKIVPLQIKKIDPEFSTDIKEYLKIHEKLKQDNILYITDQSGQKQEKIECVVNKGMYKSVHKLPGNRVLTLFGKSHLKRPWVASCYKWNEMAKGEAEACRMLRLANILTPGSRVVGVSTSESSTKVLGLLSTNFQSLVELKNCYIIDGKDRDTSNASTWVKGKNFLFSSDDERFNPANWELVTEKILNDIISLSEINFTIDTECTSLAIEKTNKNGDSENNYRLRYFGFDFAKGKNIPYSCSGEISLNQISCSITILISIIFRYEFCNTPAEKKDEVNLLKKAVEENCLRRILAKIEQRDPLDQATLLL